MSDGFLGRWSRRKLQGPEAAPEEAVVDGAPGVPPPQPSPSGGGSPQSPPPLGEGQGGGTAAPAPAPTLEDAQALTPESDFRRFVAGDVPADVKNTALKKLFADPRFNVQDGMDVYIDDYSKPDPIPPAMLKKLASAQFLKLFDEEEEKKEERREVADDPAAQTVAQSDAAEPAVPPTEDHADPDLRLQQDDAPGPEGPGTSPG